MNESPGGNRVDPSTKTNSDSTVASKSTSPWDWYEDRKWDIYENTQNSTDGNDLKGWEEDGLRADHTVENSTNSTFILINGKFKNNESNYQGMTNCTMIALNSEIESTAGWNYQCIDSIINASGTEHKMKGGKNQLETENCRIGIIKSKFTAVSTPNSFKNTNDIVRMLNSEIVNPVGIGRKGLTTMYEEGNNKVDVKLAVSDVTGCIMTDYNSTHKSANDNCYTAENCKMTTQKMTMDPKVTSLKLTNCNSVDNGSSLKGTKEMDLSGTTLKIDKPTFDGSKSISATSSTLQASAGTKVVNGDFNSVIYDLQNVEVKAISITGKSTGRLFHVTSDAVTMDDSHGEFEACNFKKTDLSKASLLTHNCDIPILNIDGSVYDLRTSTIETLNITNKSSGELSKTTVKDLTMNNSSGEFEASVIQTLSLTKSSLTTHGSDAKTISLDSSSCDLRTMTAKELSSSTSKVTLLDTILQTATCNTSQLNFSSVTGLETLNTNGCSIKLENVSSGVSNFVESSGEVTNSKLGNASVASGSLNISKTTAEFKVDDSSTVNAANCSGTMNTPVETVALMGDGSVNVIGNVKTLINKESYINTKLKHVTKAEQIIHE